MVLASGLARQAIGDEAQRWAAYSGTATDVHSGDFLYHENHWLRYRAGALAERVVLYTCKDGSPFARKTVSYVSPLTPDFQLEDESNGLRQGVRTQGGGRRVFFRADRASTEKSEALPPEPDLVADTGFDEFVRSRWRVLLDGQTVSMDFLVPSRLRSLEFKVQHLRSDQVDGVPVEVFHLKVAGVIGWVAPSIDVYYGAQDRVLIRYVGLSDLRNASKDNYQANILFPPSERKPTDEQALAAARQARLAPCP